MARQRTKGDPIQIRLTQYSDRLLRLNAEQAGMTAAQLATEMLERVLEPPKTATGQLKSRHAETCKCLICQPGLAAKGKK